VCARVCAGCEDDVKRVRECQCDLERTRSQQVSDNFCEQGNNRKLYKYAPDEGLLVIGFIIVYIYI